MIKEQSFDTNISINSDEEIKQIEIHPFYTHFYYSNNRFQIILIQIHKMKELINQLHHLNINSWEHVIIMMNQFNLNQYKQFRIKVNYKINSIPNIYNFKQRQYCIINVSKSVDIYLDNKRHQNNYKVEAGSMQLIKMNMLKNKNAKKSRNYKNATSNVRNKSPLSILKKSSCEGSLSKNSENLQYQLISNKKVSFEFTKEQIKSMKRINVSNVLIKQRTKFFFN